jgi:acyl transferase domain-containing protein/glyoxylase-like metal-dependent hydrolase (beta-lactamase superfamily II)/2-polyprenyl-3-methyl-5-hydroxy-6-metoxy-1,4-benzoquinol methylase
MEERLALQVNSLADLEEKLHKYLQDPQESGDWYRGQVRQHKETVELFSTEEEMHEFTVKWLQQGKYEKILQWWAKGLRIEWQRLYTVGAGSTQGTTPAASPQGPTTSTLPHRISLPTYPFARERYWISTPTIETHGGTDRSLTPSQRSLPSSTCPPTESLSGLSTRQLPSEEETGTVLVMPGWKEETVSMYKPEATTEPLALGAFNPLVLLCDLPDTLASRIQSQMASGKFCRRLSVNFGHNSPSRREQRFQEAVLQLIQELQHLLQSCPSGPLLIQVVVGRQKEPSFLEALAGVLKTAQLEHPKLRGQLIEIEGEPDEGELLTWLHENQQWSQEPHIRYRDGKRWVREWLEHPPVPSVPKVPWKEGGCYLITGGAGGLGRLFVQEIARHIKAATVILVGRSALSADAFAVGKGRTGLLWEVPRSDPRSRSSGSIHIDYQPVDVSDGPAMYALIQRVLTQYGHLDGIIHAAGVLRDSLLLNKVPEQVQAVLAPKVLGVERLDEASSQIPLDFFVLCSSLVSVMGNIGQADYAAANAYLDAFAHTRQAMVLAGVRQGTTVSINWPLWEEGGMHIETEMAQMMRARLGMEAMSTEVGMKALYQAMTLGQAQVMVLHGDLSKIRERIWPAPLPEYSYPAQVPLDSRTPVSAANSRHASHTVPPPEQELLRENILHQLKVILADVTRLEISEIDVDEPLENYGVDSRLMTHMTQKLLVPFKDVSPTSFYEYPTLSALGEHLLDSYPQECMRWIGELPNTNEHVGTGLAPVRESSPPAHAQTGASPVPTRLQYFGDNQLSRQNGSQTPIAIIGISGRYPQANNLTEYWEHLQVGKSCITEIPRSRWDWRDYYQPKREEAIISGKSYSKWGAFLADFDQFDPLFFQMTPREAEEIDPQERLFLEECWKALEDAGYSPSTFPPFLRQRTGVFGGITKQGFHFYSTEAQGQFPSTSFASLVNRVSYHLNLQGPSTVVDTMCSSALVAIHEACEYIRQGKGDMALAGAVNLYVHPATYIGLSRGQMISDTENGAAFGKGGHGFVPGEGVGVIVLKAYDQALADGDGIYAVIRGSAVNHNGRTSGYTTPDPGQQAAVIQQALAQSSLDPRTISYIEAAASGSEKADAVELAALTRIFGSRSRGREYKIGSVKPTLGHSEAASGMAQLTKVILCLQHKTLVPTGVPENFHPTTPFDEWPFQLQRQVSAWQRLTVDGTLVPRRAGITSVGAGGVNTHLIVEEYIPATEAAERSIEPTTPILFVLSAKNKERLSEYARQWSAYLQKEQNVDLENIAYTLQIGREEMPCRLAIVTHNQAELVRQLEQWVQEPKRTQHGSFSESKTTTDESQMLKSNDLENLAQLWASGNAVPWNNLHQGKRRVRITGLPTYPFKRRTCWIEHKPTDHAQEQAIAPTGAGWYENKAVEFYTLMSQQSNVAPGVQTEYLTFCPFAEKVPGFSLSRVGLHPEKYPDEIRRVQEKQTEMRQVLFCQEDFASVHTLLDIGCGHGTDVIQIAALYPHITTHGFTLTPAQAELGQQRIAQLNLSTQAQIWQKDSSKDAFPARYDLIIGIEVTFHIRNKAGLWQNIATSLNDNGRVLLMDYIANLRGAVVDPSTEVSIPTQQEWLELLTAHHLVIDEIIDVSLQIANFLDDPEVKDNVRDLPKVVQDTYRSYANQSISLKRGWISYCLLKLKKDTQRSAAERWQHNTQKIAQKTPYPQALAEMLKLDHIPYPPGPEANKPVGTGRGSYPPPQQPLGHPVALSIKDDLRKIFLNVLSLQPEELEEAETFQDLGIGSINVVQLLEAINSKYNLSLPTSILFECRNMDALVDSISAACDRKGQDYSNNVGAGSAQGMIPTAPVRATREGLSETPLEEVSASTRDATDRGQPCPYEMGEEQHQGNNLETRDQVISDEIAIIGLALRCAEAETQDEFWDLISQGKSGIQAITQKSWLDFLKRYASTEFPYRYGKMKNVTCFDPLFFNISPHEAEAMDVSQRILLEECYKALEDAGYTLSLLSGEQVATVIGSMGIFPSKLDFSHFSMLGSEMSILSSRIAYFMNFKGPAITIDTACSSSLVAIDIACQHLQSHAVNLAIAGGITIYAHPAPFLSMRNAGMLSPTGECRPFDRSADGIVVGDGVGVVILKRLQDAERDGDHIYGVIQASGTNQDGQTSGITVPSFQAQSQLQESIYRKHHINPCDLQYIEAHGTATKLGDPIEIHALTDAFEKFTDQKRFCAIGSLKANIGHTGAAAGVLSVIKVLLSFKYAQIPPSINFKSENEHINFANSPVYVNTTLKPWPSNAHGSRLAAISSFGFSGTNAHLVLKEYMVQSQRIAANPQVNEANPGVLILSAKREEGLRMLARAIVVFLRKYDDVKLADLFYSFQVGRESLLYRLALVVTSKEMLVTQLEQFVAGENAAYLERCVRKINKKYRLIGDTEEGQEFVQKLIQHKKLEQLANLWLHGEEIRWEGLYPQGSVKRLPSLPTYPFVKENYELAKIELESSPLSPLVHPLAKASSRLVECNTRLLTPDWKEERDGNSGDGSINEQEMAPSALVPCDCLMAPNKITLRPLADQPMRSKNGVDQSQPSTIGDNTIPTTNRQMALSVEIVQSDDPELAPPLEEELVRRLAEVLHIEESAIDVETRFGEMGLDSVMGVQWIQSLNKRYASKLKSSSIYEYPTIRQLAHFLEKEVLKNKHHQKEIYRVILAPNPSLRRGAGTNTIVLGDERTGAVVIDPATEDPEYLSAIVQEGQRRGGIRRILITHGHADHMGGASALRAELGVPLLAFSKKQVLIADEEMADHALFPIGDDMLHALHTPGHSPDHLCFWLEKQRILFAGDLLAHSGPSLIPPPPEGDLQAYLHSLERIQQLECVEIIPAHGERIPRPQEILAECLARCQKRKEQILAAVQNAPQGIGLKTIVEVVYKDSDASLYDTLAISVLSNLSLLEREGKVKQRENKQSEQNDYWIYEERTS